MSELLYWGQNHGHELAVHDDPLLTRGVCSCGKWRMTASNPESVIERARRHLSEVRPIPEEGTPTTCDSSAISPASPS